MSNRWSSRAVAGALVAAVRESPLTMLAAGIAYYAFVSLLPLLLLTVAVATAIGGESVAAAVLRGLGGVLSPSGQNVVEEALTGPAGRGGATVVGLSVLLWSSLKLFRGLDMAFSMVYGTAEDKRFFGQLRNALTALVAVGVAVGATTAVGIAATVFSIDIVGVLGPFALVVVLTGAFLPLYYIFPDVAMTPRAALPGAAFAAIGWTVLGTAFRLYAAVAGVSVYGVVGAILLLVTWFYIGGIVLLLGAVLNGVLGDDIEPDGDRQLQHGPPRDPGQRLMSEGAAGDDESEATADEERNREGEFADLRAEIADLEAQIDDRTVHRDEIESDLRRYVRRKVRRGHAAGWGPYLVLLYGTVMTVAAFYFLAGFWAVTAMLVVWLSTLGLYVVMVVVGTTARALGIPGRVADRVRSLRD